MRVAFLGPAACRLTRWNGTDFCDRLTALLNAPSIEGSGKAANIAAENERTFHTSRTIAQIRPVFRSDALQPPLGGVVLHQLHISAWDNEGNDHTYVVTLDTEDLDF